MAENPNDFSYYCYLLSTAYYVTIFTYIISRFGRLDRITRALLGMLSLIPAQGLISLFFYFADFPVSFINLGITQAFIAAILHLYLLFFRGSQEISKSQLALNSRDSMFSIALGLASACLGGVSFYTLQLIPSSMSGDTVRYLDFIRNFNLSFNQQALPYKSTYFFFCSTFLQLPTGLSEDKVFLLTNILLLGIFSSVTNLFARLIHPSLSTLEVALLSALTSLGYPLFVLHYGTFPLLLAAVLAIASLIFLHQSLNSAHSPNYLLAMFFTCGVQLTHPYFTPELLCFFLLCSVGMIKTNYISPRTLITLHVPSWILICLIFYFSVLFGQPMTTAQYTTYVFQNSGLSTSRAFGDSAALLLIGMPYLYKTRNAQSNQLLRRALLSFYSFTIFMLLLYYLDRAAMYYVSRNQILLVPLSAISLSGSLVLLRKRHLTIARILSLVAITTLVFPYFCLRRIPLALSNLPYLSLLSQNSGTNYHVNPITTSYSPLLFTGRDRKLLGSKKNKCFKDIRPPRGIRSLAVLGSDHQTMWMGYYLKVYPSLFRRNDMFIFQRGYQRSFFRWKRIKRHRIIMLIPHLAYKIPSRVLLELTRKHKILCRGDSFTVFLKSRRAKLKRI